MVEEAETACDDAHFSLTSIEDAELERIRYEIDWRLSDAEWYSETAVDYYNDALEATERMDVESALEACGLLEATITMAH